MKRREIGFYKDASGNQYQVIELTEQIKSSDFHDTQTIDGLKMYETSCGLTLNKSGENFKTIQGSILVPVE